jgi:hypothetical protein
MEINRDRETRREPFTVEEFLLLAPEQAKPREQSAEDMLLVVTALNNVYGGTVCDGQRN